MVDPLTLVGIAAGGIGILGAVLFVYVYQAANAMEKRFAAMRSRAELVVHDFDALKSNLGELSKAMQAKASYQDTEKLLSRATGNAVLRQKTEALGEVNPSVRVRLT
ncbi:hypothetical protein HY572_01470 [Candidatus Micrarchaeota archaeon]|nr:hypothetical protein [Candidatus Micrarchaeota archaeon]